jgi:hypothetical protein
MLILMGVSFFEMLTPFSFFFPHNGCLLGIMGKNENKYLEHVFTFSKTLNNRLYWIQACTRWSHIQALPILVKPIAKGFTLDIRYTLVYKLVLTGFWDLSRFKAKLEVRF